MAKRKKLSYAARRASHRKCMAAARKNEALEVTQTRQASDRKRKAAVKKNEDQEVTQTRQASDRKRKAAVKKNEDQEVTQTRQASDRKRKAAAKKNEDQEVTQTRQASDRKRKAAAKKTEDQEVTQTRQASDRKRKAAARGTEAPAAKLTRLQERRKCRKLEVEDEPAGRKLQQRPLRGKNCLNVKKYEAFHYDPQIDYAAFPHVSIGRLSIKCTFCDALKFKGETPGLCCSGGKVSLPELPEVPEPLKSLMNGKHDKSSHFLGLIRKYNSCFQMTSFGTSVQLPKPDRFTPTFKIQGQVYHKVGSLKPIDGHEPKFLQIYFLGDEEIEARRRCSVIPGLDKDVVLSLQQMLHNSNPYIRVFKTAIEKSTSDDLRIIIKPDRKPAGGHKRVYNVPEVNEVAIVIAGNEFEKRDIVLHTRTDQLQTISETHVAYDALQYPLIFPSGENGYSINIPQVDPQSGSPKKKTVSAMAFYSYRLMLRSVGNHLLLCRHLLHQFLVDMYAKIEAERLLFIRLNQKKLRVEQYIHLKDAVVSDGNGRNHGQLLILPSSFTGSPRNLHEYCQDALTYVRCGGKPSLFITYTFNPNCDEMTENLLHGQLRTDRHDLIARIFRQKVVKFIDIVVKRQVFGHVKYWLYSIEWQKRGLPHAHFLIWLTQTLKPDQIDQLISAEIPNPASDKELYDLVTKHMVHGPCLPYNMRSPCVKDKACSKKFPRQFAKDTKTENNGYPLYRRRSPEDGGFTFMTEVKFNDVQVDNRWIVPYNPLLLKIFQSHINVEFCNSVKSIKYILKYVHKGSDQAVFSAQRSDNEIDEVSNYVAGRYISSNEAAWRIFGFPIHERYPAVQHLDVHLENGQRIYFTDTNLLSRLANPPNTTLTAFFQLCTQDDFAKTLIYSNVPKFYTWNKGKKQFFRRKEGHMVEGHVDVRASDTLGRVYTVHIRNLECYYLRMLLHKIPGPTSFEYLRTVNGQIHATYQEACMALGLLESDNQWEETLKEAADSVSPFKIRTLFAMILSHCQPANPKALWEKFKDSMSEDIVHRYSLANQPINESAVLNETLIHVEDLLFAMVGSSSLSAFGLPSPVRGTVGKDHSPEIMRELSYDTEDLVKFVAENEPLLNTDQQVIYHSVLDRYHRNAGGVIFIDAPGGTGKTFLIKLLLAKIRGDGKIAIAVASSGIAATLMPGGRTAHSTLQIPIDLLHQETPVCNIKKGTGKAQVLQQARALFWDEISMMHKHGVEAVDRTLKDIRSCNSLMGGLLVILAGDFRQTLPIIPRGTMVDEIRACFKSSPLWCHVEVMKLHINMRVNQSPSSNAKEYTNYILKIGNGQQPATSDGIIKLSPQFSTFCSTLKELINAVYYNFKDNYGKEQWLLQRAILTPLNDRVEEINTVILNKIPCESTTYFSIDTCINDDDSTKFPTEFLNSLHPPGLPTHKLELKVGAPVMLMRNLNPPALCNGTRLTVKQLHKHLIEATILTGAHKGEHVFIPRIPLIPNDLPFEFKRLQFPVRLAYAMTINKAQGQSLQVTGLDLSTECFSHGQLYVAMSRVTDPSHLYVLTEYGETRNVVYHQVLT